MSTHWTNQYIGLPFRKGGRVPSVGLDCWGLIVHVYKREYGIHVREYPTLELIDSGEQEQLYTDLLQSNQIIEITEEEAQDGDLVALGQGQTFHHVGIVVRGERINVLHSHVRSSVIETLLEMKRVGWNLVKFYRHAERHTRY